MADIKRKMFYETREYSDIGGGYFTAEKMRYVCGNCGAVVSPKAKKCPSCNEKLVPTQDIKDKIKAEKQVIAKYKEMEELIKNTLLNTPSNAPFYMNRVIEDMRDMRNNIDDYKRWDIEEIWQETENISSLW